MLHYLEQTPAYHTFIQEMELGSKDREDNWDTYQAYSARVDQMICLADLMWPEFTEREGLILRNQPKEWDEWMQRAKKANWGKTEIEYVLNHLHLTDIFINDPDRSRIEKAVYVALAHMIADMWRGRLAQLFPIRVFEVGVDNEEFEVEVYAYEKLQPL